MKQAEFLCMLRHLQSHVDIVHVILGDFNINYTKDDYVFLENYLANQYKMVVDTPTHISGSSIDHIYVHKDITNNYKIKVQKQYVYFSDHDAFKLDISPFE